MLDIRVEGFLDFFMPMNVASTHTKKTKPKNTTNQKNPKHLCEWLILYVILFLNGIQYHIKTYNTEKKWILPLSIHHPYQ